VLRVLPSSADLVPAGSSTGSLSQRTPGRSTPTRCSRPCTGQKDSTVRRGGQPAGSRGRDSWSLLSFWPLTFSSRRADLRTGLLPPYAGIFLARPLRLRSWCSHRAQPAQRRLMLPRPARSEPAGPVDRTRDAPGPRRCGALVNCILDSASLGREAARARPDVATSAGPSRCPEQSIRQLKWRTLAPDAVRRAARSRP